MTFIDHYWQPKVSATTLIDFTSTYINFSSSSSNKKDTFKVLLFEDSSTFKASKASGLSRPLVHTKLYFSLVIGCMTPRQQQISRRFMSITENL